MWTQGGAEVFVSVTQPRPKTKAELEQEKQQKQAPVKDLSNLDDLAKVLNTHSELLQEKTQTPA
jgi:hypothetical protein